MEAEPQAPPLRVGQLIGRMLIGVLILMAVLGLTGWLFGPQIKEAAEWFVAELGLPGLFACFFVPDAVPVPGAHEVCTGFSLVGGVPFWTVVSVASAGSVSGGMAGYGLGRALGHTPRVKAFMAGRGANAFLLVKRHGATAVALGAVSPIPYSVCAWAAGALRMPFGRFVLVSLLRFPRVAFYLWLIQVGVANF